MAKRQSQRVIQKSANLLKRGLSVLAFPTYDSLSIQEKRKAVTNVFRRKEYRRELSNYSKSERSRIYNRIMSEIDNMRNFENIKPPSKRREYLRRINTYTRYQNQVPPPRDLIKVFPDEEKEREGYLLVAERQPVGKIPEFTNAIGRGRLVRVKVEGGGIMFPDKIYDNSNMSDVLGDIAGYWKKIKEIPDGSEKGIIFFDAYIKTDGSEYLLVFSNFQPQ